MLLVPDLGLWGSFAPWTAAGGRAEFTVSTGGDTVKASVRGQAVFLLGLPVDAPSPPITTYRWPLASAQGRACFAPNVLETNVKHRTGSRPPTSGRNRVLVQNKHARRSCVCFGISGALSLAGERKILQNFVQSHIWFLVLQNTCNRCDSRSLMGRNNTLSTQKQDPPHTKWAMVSFGLTSFLITKTMSVSLPFQE